MSKPRFSKGEKKKCKFYDYGKCKIQSHGKDCRPRTKEDALPEFVEGCSGFVPIEAGEACKEGKCDGTCKDCQDKE